MPIGQRENARNYKSYRGTFLLISVLVVGMTCRGILFGQNPTTTPPRTKSETRRELRATSFYETTSPLPPGKPGTLIRSEAFDDYDLSAEMSALRILYHSRSASDKDVVVSAVVLIPAGKPPAGGWPVIAWAHGFSGIARRCAPSLMRNILNGPFLSMYLSLGYAVVATDYAGLGTYSRYAALDAESNAEDVVNSIPAARAATPLLSSNWMVMGDSQGALVAIKVAERSEPFDPDFLGSVAISGVANPRDLYERMAQKSPDSMLAVLAYGIKTVFPDFKPGDMLTDKGLATSEQIESTCGTPGNAAILGAEILKPDWEKNHSVQQFLSRNEAGQKPARGPLLIIAAAADPVVPASLTSHVVDQMCRQHDHVDYEEYPEVDAGSVLGVSVREQMNWIQARFAGRAATSNCK